MARLCFYFRHCGEPYLPNWEGTGHILSVRRGETYLPHTANLIYNPQIERSAQTETLDIREVLEYLDAHHPENDSFLLCFVSYAIPMKSCSACKTVHT